MTNREILFIVKLRNDARRAINGLVGDLARVSRAGEQSARASRGASTGMQNIRDTAATAARAVRDLAGANTSAAGAMGAQTRQSAQQARQSAQQMTQYQREMRAANKATADAYAAAADAQNAAEAKHAQQQKDARAEAAAGKKQLAAQEVALQKMVAEHTRAATEALKEQARIAAENARFAGIADRASAARRIVPANPATSPIGKMVDRNGNIVDPALHPVAKPKEAPVAEHLTPSGINVVDLMRQARAAKGAVAELETEGVSRMQRFRKGMVDAFDRTRDALNQWTGASKRATAGSFGRNVASEAKQIASGVKDAEKATESFISKLHLGSGAIREIIVLGREMGRGDTTRLAGSFSILLQNIGLFNALGPVLLGTFAALAVVIGTVVAAMAVGSVEANRFQNMLSLTGNYAGLTAGSYEDMARRIADATNTSIGANKALISSLAGSNEFTSGQIEKLVTAAEQLGRATGQEAEEVLKGFEKMADGPTKYAETFIQQYTGVIDPALVEHVRQLEATGQSHEALAVLINGVTAGIADKTVENTGIIIRAWHGATNAVSEFWGWLKTIGQTETTAQQLAGVNRQLSEYRRLGEPLKNHIFGLQTPALLKEKDALEKKLAAETKAAEATTEHTRQVHEQQAGIRDLQANYGTLIDSQARFSNETKRLQNDLRRAVGWGATNNPAAGFDQVLKRAATSSNATVRNMAQNWDQTMDRLRRRTMPQAWKADAKADRQALADAKRAERERIAEEKRAAREREENIRRTTSEMKQIASAYDPYLSRLGKDEEAQDRISTMLKLRATDQAAFTQALDKSGLSLDQFNTIAFQVKDNLKSSDIAAFFKQYEVGFEDMTDKQRRAEQEGLLTRMLEAAKNKGTELGKVLAGLGIKIGDIERVAATFRMNLDPKQGREFFAQYDEGYDLFVQRTASAKLEQDRFVTRLKDARANGGQAYIDFLAEVGIRSAALADRAIANYDAGIDPAKVQKSQSALGSLISTYSGFSQRISENMELQRQLRQLETLRQSDLPSFDEALRRLGLTQADYNVAVERAQAKLGESKGVFGAARAAAAEYAQSLQDNGLRMADVWRNAFSSMGNALATFIRTGKLNFRSMIDSFVSDLLRMQTQKWMLNLVGMAFPGVGAGVGHSGGLAGASGSQGRVVDPSVFAGAKRYHVGGLAGVGGLRSGEVPVVAKKHEALLPTARMPDGNFGVKAILPEGRGGMGGGFNFAPILHISVDGGNGDSAAIGQSVSSQTVKALEEMVKRVIGNEMRDGGLLAGA